MIIPTRDRRAILCETLARLEPQLRDVPFEAVVVDDGSADGTSDVVEQRAARSPYDLTLIEQPGLGPATARNRALSQARAPVCLFIDDDAWPRPDLLLRHRDFHRRRPEREAALLGHVSLAPTPPPTPFMRWLAGLHLGYEGIEDPENAGGECFFSGNVSAKTAFLRSVGGFDEGLKQHEDIDIGLRLQRLGMRLVYDPETVVEHCHPTDLATAIDRYHRVGTSLARFAERYPEHPVARRPGLRHRVKAGALTAVVAAGARTPRLQRETWRFLCHEAAREGYWSAVDGSEERGDSSRAGLRIGGTLARLASRDADAQMPAEVAAAS